MKKFFLGMILVGMQFILSGCIALYSYKDYEVKVIDSQSNESIEGSEILIHYYFFLVLNSPEQQNEFTNDSGWSKLRVANFRLCEWNVFADDYEPFNGFGYREDGRVPDNCILNGNRVIIPLQKSENTK